MPLSTVRLCASLPQLYTIRRRSVVILNSGAMDACPETEEETDNNLASVW